MAHATVGHAPFSFPSCGHDCIVDRHLLTRKHNEPGFARRTRHAILSCFDSGANQRRPPEFQNCSGAGYGSCFRLDDIRIFPTGSGRGLALLKISAKVVLGQSEVAAKYVRIQANDLQSSFTRTVTTNSSGTADFGSMPEGEYQLTLVEETYVLELETDEVRTGPTPRPVRLRGTVQQTGFAFMDINENGTYESPTQNQIADEDLQVSGTFAWAGLDQNFGTSDDVSEEISGVGALRFPARLPYGNYRIRELKSAI